MCFFRYGLILISSTLFAVDWLVPIVDIHYRGTNERLGQLKVQVLFNFFEGAPVSEPLSIFDYVLTIV